MGNQKERTNAQMEMLYNVASKAMISTFVFGPTYFLRRKYGVLREGDKMTPEQAATNVKVKQWSDIFWLSWAKAAESPEQASALKYIFKYHVVTEFAERVIEALLGLPLNGFPDSPDGEWPPGDNYVFRPNQPGFNALLGIPHGAYARKGLPSCKAQF